MSPLYVQNPNDATSGSTVPAARDGIGFYSTWRLGGWFGGAGLVGSITVLHETDG